MRVTKTIRTYIYNRILEKAKDKLDEAQKRANAQDAEDDKNLKLIEAYADSLCAEMTSKVEAFAKKKGYTWRHHSFLADGTRTPYTNSAFVSNIRESAFEELYRNSFNDNAGYKNRTKINEEPERILTAVKAAADKIVFDLELGNTDKSKFEKLLDSINLEI